MRHGYFTALVTAAIFMHAAAGGCGSEVTHVQFAGGADGAGGVVVGGGAGGSQTLPPDGLCDLLASKICAGRQGCCAASGLGFDQAGCEAYERGKCEVNVAAVEAGWMQFDASYIDACLAAMQPYWDLCYLGMLDRVAMFEARRLCRSIFVGDQAIGGPCDRHAVCRQAADQEDITYCDGEAGVCVLIDVGADGDDCELGAGSPPPHCAAGLYCDALTDLPPPWPGSCKPVTSPGQACAPWGMPPVPTFECGIGYVCAPDGGPGACQEAGEEGEPCKRPRDCKSLSCEGQLCGALTLIVDSEACTGVQ